MVRRNFTWSSWITAVPRFRRIRSCASRWPASAVARVWAWVGGHDGAERPFTADWPDCASAAPSRGTHKDPAPVSLLTLDSVPRVTIARPRVIPGAVALRRWGQAPMNAREEILTRLRA